MEKPGSSKIQEKKQPRGGVEANGVLHNLAEFTWPQHGWRTAKRLLYAQELQTQMGDLGKLKEP